LVVSPGAHLPLPAEEVYVPEDEVVYLELSRLLFAEVRTYIFIYFSPYYYY